MHHLWDKVRNEIADDRRRTIILSHDRFFSRMDSQGVAQSDLWLTPAAGDERCLLELFEWRHGICQGAGLRRCSSA